MSQQTTSFQGYNPLSSSPVSGGLGVLLVIFMAMFSQALLGPLFASEANPDGSAFLRMMWLPVYAVILMVSLFRMKVMFGLALQMPILIALFAMVAASVLWSIDVHLTFRRVIAFLATSLFGLYLAARYTWRDVIWLYAFAMLILVAGSLIAGGLTPGFGVTPDGDHAGAWKGLWFEKNALGGNMARASFVFGLLFLIDVSRRWLWAAAFALAIILVLLSTSKTALMGALLGFGVLCGGAVIRRGPILAASLVWTGIMLGGAFVIVFVTNPDLVFGLIGRDASLTGRTDIWVAISEAISERPWLGHGYGAFWSPGSIPADIVRDELQWNAPTAHNAWLEIWLSVGVIGMALAVSSFGMSLARAIVRAFSTWSGLFAAGFLLQLLLFSISESIVAQQNELQWVMFVAVAASLVKTSGDNRSFGNREPRAFREFV